VDELGGNLKAVDRQHAGRKPGDEAIRVGIGANHDLLENCCGATDDEHNFALAGLRRFASITTANALAS
jgi:hypothetical protein